LSTLTETVCKEEEEEVRILLWMEMAEYGQRVCVEIYGNNNFKAPEFFLHI
jgi:hypothetical protein